MIPIEQVVESTSHGVVMIWCDRPSSKRLGDAIQDETRRLATDYHYVCPLDYAQLTIRELSSAKDPRVVLRPCPKCGTKWYGPTLSYIRSHPANGPRPL